MREVSPERTSVHVVPLPVDLPATPDGHRLAGPGHGYTHGDTCEAGHHAKRPSRFSHRGSNGYRYFNEEDLQRLRRIAFLREVERLNVGGSGGRSRESNKGSSPPPAAGRLGASPHRA